MNVVRLDWIFGILYGPWTPSGVIPKYRTKSKILHTARNKETKSYSGPKTKKQNLILDNLVVKAYAMHVAKPSSIPSMAWSAPNPLHCQVPGTQLGLQGSPQTPHTPTNSTAPSDPLIELQAWLADHCWKEPPSYHLRASLYPLPPQMSLYEDLTPLTRLGDSHYLETVTSSSVVVNHAGGKITEHTLISGFM